MSRNSAAARARKQANLEHYGLALEGFAGEHDLELHIFGEGVHWRLEGTMATLDVWPTTGKYWIKDVPLGLTAHRSGHLPHDYNELDKFLTSLFKGREDI